jgi:hypothetical protein
MGESAVGGGQVMVMWNALCVGPIHEWGETGATVRHTDFGL